MDTHPLATVTVANRSQLFPIQRIATTHTHSVMGAFSPRPVTVMQPLNFLKNPLHPMPLFPSLLGNLSVQPLSHVQLSEIPWTAAHQASLSITNSWSLLKLMSIELVIPPNHLILCCPLLLLSSIFPSIRSFPVSQFFASGGQRIGASVSASVLPMNIQD